MIITSKQQLKQTLKEIVLRLLMEDLSKKVENVLRTELDKAELSTSTLQDYVTHLIEPNGGGDTTTIYIDSRLAQKQTEGTKTWYKDGIVFVKFISLDGSNEWGGRSIVGNMVYWLEETGAYGPLGNNPITPIGMFEKLAKSSAKT